MDKQKLSAIFSELELEEVEVKGQKVYIKKLKAGDFSDYKRSLWKNVNGKPVMQLQNHDVKLVILALCDEKGENLYTMADIEVVRNFSSNVLNKLYEVADKLNPINEEKAVKN